MTVSSVVPMGCTRTVTGHRVWGLYPMPGTSLGTLHALTHLTLTAKVNDVPV